MRFLILILLLIPSLSFAEYIDFSSKWATSDNYRLQAKARIKGGFHADLEIENSFYNQKSDIKLGIRRIGVSYGIDLNPIKIYAGGTYNIQQAPGHSTEDFKWPEVFLSAHYKVDNYPLLIDIKYSLPTSNGREALSVNMQRQENSLTVGVGYEFIDGLFIRFEKESGGDYFIGFRKWL